MSIQTVSGITQSSLSAPRSVSPSGPIGSPLARRDVDVNVSSSQVSGPAQAGLGVLYWLQIVARDSQREESLASIITKRNDIKIERQKIERAIKRAMEEAEKKAGWGRMFGKLSTLAKVAGVVAAAASVVGSGGTLTAPVLIALSGTLLSVSAKPVAGVVGGDAMEKVLSYSGAALSLAGGAWSAINACSGGVQAGSTAAQAGSSAVRASSCTAQTGRVVAQGASITAGLFNTASAYALYESGLHAAREGAARADETALRAQQRFFQRAVEDLIQTLKDAEQSFTRANTALVKAIDAQAASGLAIASLGGRS